MGYIRLAAAIAWSKTMTDMFGSWTNRIIVAGFSLLSGALAYFWAIYSEQDAPEQVLFVIPIGAAAAAAMALIGFLVNWLCRVPYEQWVNAAQVVEAMRPAPVEPDPPDEVLAKQDLSDFVSGPLTQADKVVREAVRLSAYAFLDAWRDHPAGKLGWAGILSSLRPPKITPFLANPANIRGVSLDVVQASLLEALVEYRVGAHKLHEVVSGLTEHGLLKDSGGFFAKVREWRLLHDQVINRFEILREKAQFANLREAKTETYLADPNFDLGAFDLITRGTTDAG